MGVERWKEPPDEKPRLPEERPPPTRAWTAVSMAKQIKKNTAKPKTQYINRFFAAFLVMITPWVVSSLSVKDIKHRGGVSKRSGAPVAPASSVVKRGRLRL